MGRSAGQIISNGHQPGPRSAGAARRNAIRVGHLIKALGRGGAETLLPHLVRASPEHDVEIGYFLPWKDAMVAELLQAGAAVHCFEARATATMFARVGAVRAWMRDRGLDLLHCHLPISGVVGRLAARGTGVPVVYTEHNVQERYRGFTRWLNRLTWSAQRHVIAVSEEVARSIADGIGTKVPVTVISNGIPEVPFQAISGRDARREAHGLDRAPTVGTVAVFRAQKRLDLWLEVARRVVERVPEARFVWVGDGPLRSELERRSRELGLDVVMVGLRKDVPEWLACMDVFLTTSEFEGLPLALLEAMMVGTPVVATRVGGVAEVIEDGADGFVLPFGDVDGQAERVVALLEDAAARERLARAGRATVERRFGIERMAREVSEVYSRVVGDAR